VGGEGRGIVELQDLFLEHNQVLALAKYKSCSLNMMVLRTKMA